MAQTSATSTPNTTSSSSSSPSSTKTRKTASSSPSSRIHFGSCNSQHLPQRLWSTILQRQAQAFVWAGDAVYGDGHDGRHVVAATPAKLAADYDWMLSDNNAGYQNLTTCATHNVTIFGTWDDHDYGINNGDKTYPHRRETAQLFVDFIERSNHGRHNFALMRQRAAAGHGVYGVIVLDYERANAGSLLLSDDEAGIDPESTGSNHPSPHLSDKSVAIFAIDVRSNKSPWNEHGAKTDYQGDFLGERQWKWLQAALARSTAAVNIVVTGLQVHTDRFVNGNVAEEWSRFPMAQHRLYQALLQPNVRSPFIISGDVHMGELLRRDCQQADIDNRDNKPASTRSLVEMTTSGMTHSWGTYFCSRPEQLNPICRYSYLQRLLAFAMHWAHQSTAWKELVYHEETKTPQYTLELNFGEFEFDWEERTVTTRLIGLGGVELQSHTWDMTALSGQSTLGSNTLQQHDFVHAANEMLQKGGGTTLRKSDYYCLPYRGPQTQAHKYFGFLTAFALILAGFVLPIILPFIIARRCLRSPCQKVKIQ